MEMHFYDMHTHSLYSHDSTCPIEEMAEAQIKQGVAAFAVTDHCGYVDARDVDDAYFAAGEAAIKYADKIEILRGLEIGEGIWDLSLSEFLASKHEFDVVIGSVHAVRYSGMTNAYSAIDFSDIPENVLYGFMSQYFEDVYETAVKVPCDILAHLTCPLRYINGKYGRDFDIRKFWDIIERILLHIIEHSIALEINTSCINTPFNSFMPDEWIAEKYRSMGGYLVTLGSDAHVSQNAANGFQEAVLMLKKLGFTHCYYYKNRKPVSYKI